MKRALTTDLALLVLAVVLMLGGAVMLVADAMHPGIAIPVIAVGIAITAIVQARRRRQQIQSH
jgi:hypothetical protein